MELVSGYGSDSSSSSNAAIPSGAGAGPTHAASGSASATSSMAGALALVAPRVAMRPEDTIATGPAQGPIHPHAPHDLDGRDRVSAVCDDGATVRTTGGRENVAVDVAVDSADFEHNLYGGANGLGAASSANAGEENAHLQRAKRLRLARGRADPWSVAAGDGARESGGGGGGGGGSGGNDGPDDSLLTPAMRKFLAGKKAKEDSAAEAAAAEAAAAAADGADADAVAGAGQNGAKRRRTAAAAPVTTVFHGKSETDFAGRTYMYVPRELRPADEPRASFVPKGAVRTLTGHTKGVSRVRFFPRSAHLLLSASMDGTVKLWDASGTRGGGCLRSFLAHSKAVRDVSFSSDGSRFLSASFDKRVILWDTETGKVISEFAQAQAPSVARLNPGRDAGHEFLCTSGKEVLQWDTRARKSLLTYARHLSVVNAVSFFDEGRKFVSSSDDKSLRVWEYGIPVEVRTISEPWMGSMPALTTHPSDKFVLATSLDNQVLLYNTDPRFKLNKKKRLIGHRVAGYACETAVSPDGQWVCGGDADGSLFFWGWSSTKQARKFTAHSEVLISVDWGNAQSPTVATGSWDGTIKLWG